MGTLTKFRKNSKRVDKVLIGLLFFMNVIITPVGLYQYSLWYDDKHYSFGFMVMGIVLLFLLFAKIVEIVRR